MKLTATLILAAAAVANARVIERQLIVPQSFGLKLVSSDAKWNNKYIHPATLETTDLSASSITSFADMTFMLIGSNLFHGSNSANALMAGEADAPITAAAVPTYFRMVPSATTPLYFASVQLPPTGSDLTSGAMGVDISTGFAMTKDGHLTHDRTENWVACDADGESASMGGLYIVKGAVQEKKGCSSVKVVQA